MTFDGRTSATVEPRGGVVPESLSRYFVLLLAFVSVAGVVDGFATQFRYTMTTYVRQDFQVGFGDLAGMMSWVYLASCLSFVPRMLADVFGRKPMLCVTFFGLCVFQGSLGLARTPLEYVVGLSFVAIFYKSDIWMLVISEEAPPRHRGLWATTAVALTGAGAISLGQLVRAMGPEPDAWRMVARVPIWGTAAVVPILLFVRETTHFETLRATRRRGPVIATLLAPFRPGVRHSLVALSLLKMGYVGGIGAGIALLGSEYLRTANGFDRAAVGRIVQMDVAASMVAVVAFGAFSDRFGRRRCFYLLGMLYSAALVALATFPKGTSAIIAMFVLQSFCATALYGILRVATMELLPNDCRATGSAWTDLSLTVGAAGTARLVGALTAGNWGVVGTVPLSWVIVAGALLSVALLPLYSLLPETRGRHLEEV